jgi:SAM-dependent methyltransferase
MYKIHIDHPQPGEAVQPAQLFDGWTISPDPSESVAVTVNGRSVGSHFIPRPDVEADNPGRNGKGFMFFFEADPDINDYNINFRIGEAERGITFSLGVDSLKILAETIAIREIHRGFLETALACPRCHWPVEGDEIEARLWTCRHCTERCDCRRGLDLIPESYANKAEIRFQGAICSHGYDGDVEALISRVGADGGTVLDCGAGWRHRLRANVITTEILRYPSTDVVAVGEHLPFRDGSFDAVLSLHVLEHVKNPFVCAEELVRVLKPGGTLYVVTPYIVGVHGFPFHFFNPTPSGLIALFDGKIEAAEVSVPRVGHPLAALKDLLFRYSDYFDAPALDRFRRTSIGELIDSSFDAILSSELTTAFHEEGTGVLAGIYRITGTKM